MSKQQLVDPNHLLHIRHTLAHLLAASVIELYPGAQNAIGPAIDDGFYQDFFIPEPISDKELPGIEKKMREKLKAWQKLKTSEMKTVSVEEARKQFAWNQYKTELINDFAKESKGITFSLTGDFLDLCKGGHAEDLAQIKPDIFKLDRVAGAYWKGNEKNIMLTRIYGLAFESKEKLKQHLFMLEEAKKRDHRKLGKEMDLFTFSDLVGAGLPLYTPRGTILRDQLAQFSEELQRANGFQKVWIPHITKNDLYKKSGHWDKFGSELMLVKSQETSDEFVMKPMNCPHHTQIFASRPRSYRDLPIRYMETTTVYRDEKTGELSGLTRVRSLTQDDAHIFCAMEQVESEFQQIMSMIKTLYNTLKMNFHARLSFSDPDQPEKYLGDRSQWEQAEATIEAVAKKLHLDYVIAPGEAAFYGPKIDIMVTDALGREWQCATEQLDFVQPMRFGLEYTDHDGAKKTPVMIHKALLGTIDRFLGVYIEHTAGAFPTWLAPVQLAILPVGEDFVAACKELRNQFVSVGIRCDLRDENESVGYKIRATSKEKIPYVIVVGEREAPKNGEWTPDTQLSVRVRGQEELLSISLGEFLKKIQEEIRERK